MRAAFISKMCVTMIKRRGHSMLIMMYDDDDPDSFV